MYEYFAFISYSSVDEKLATKIHKLLESVNLPSDMAKIVPNGLEGRRKFGPVFRDKDELPSSSSLPEALRKYLAKSAYLIVLCSPDAAKSKWVNEEIEYFKLSQGAGKIFCIILNGKPEFWSEQNPQGAFPPSLKDDRSRSVPLAANISDGTAKLDRETLRLVAGMLGVSFDMLYRRERRRQRRIIVGAVGLSMLVLCPLVFFLVRAELATKAAINSASASAKIAREKADQAAINDSIALSQQSDLAYAAGDYRAAAAIALEGMPDRARQIDRPLEPKAQAALSRAIWKLASVERFQQSEDCFHPLLVRKVSKGLWCVTSNDDNKLTIHRPGAIDETFLTDGLPVAQASNLDGSVFAVGTASGILQLHTAFGKVISFTAHGGTGEEMHAPTISSSSASTSVAKSRNSSINQVVISPNSEVIATLGQDGFVKLWSLEGKELFSRKFDGGPRSVTFYPDSTKFVVGSFEGFSTWSLNGRQESNQRFIRQTVGAVAISPDKSWLAYELTDNKLYIESRSGGDGQWTVPISALGLRGHLEFSEDSQRLLHVGGRDLMVLSLATRSVLSRYRSDDITVDGQFLDPHGNEVLLNSPTSIWHVNSLLFEAIDFHPSSFGWTDIELQPNGPLVAATEDQRVAFFNMQGEKLEANLSHEARVWAVKFSPDGKKMLTTSSDKTAKLWDVEQIVPTPKKRQSMNEILTDIATGAYESSYKPLPSKVLRGHSSIVWDGTFSPDGQSILTTSMDGTSRLWDLDGHLLSDLRAPDYPIGQLQKYDPFTNADEPRKWHHGYFSRSGNLILTVTGDNAARLWDKNGILKSTLNVGTARVWDAAFSPDEQEITTVSSDGHVVFWSQDGKKISEFDAKLSEVSAIDFVGESKDLAIKNSSTYIWSHDGKLTTRVIGSNGQISPDGTTMVTLRGEKIEGHDMEGNLLFSIDSFARDIHFLGESQIFVTSSGLVTLQKPPLGENLVSLAKKLLTSCLNEYERQAWQLKPITDISTNPRYCQ